MFGEFEERNLAAVAISQEDVDLPTFARMPRRFEGKFPILADPGRWRTKAIGRTTAYLVDPDGIVRQVFPMVITTRPSWNVVLGEFDRLQAAAKDATLGSD